MRFLPFLARRRRRAGPRRGESRRGTRRQCARQRHVKRRGISGRDANREPLRHAKISLSLSLLVVRLGDRGRRSGGDDGAIARRVEQERRERTRRRKTKTKTKRQCQRPERRRATVPTRNVGAAAESSRPGRSTMLGSRLGESASLARRNAETGRRSEREPEVGYRGADDADGSRS